MRIKAASADWIRHDHMHCANKECPKHDTCFRFLLSEEDKEKEEMWCAYGDCHPDKDGECREYIDRREYDGEKS